MDSDPAAYQQLVGPKGGTTRGQRRRAKAAKEAEAAKAAKEAEAAEAAEAAKLEGANILASINSPNPADREVDAANILASRLRVTQSPGPS